MRWIVSGRWSLANVAVAMLLVGLTARLQAESVTDMNYLVSQPVTVKAVVEDDFLTTLYTLPAWVAEIDRVCPWRIDGGEGYVRVIRTEQYGIHRLYLQWIRKGIASGPTEAIATVSVEEIRDQYQVRVQMPTAQLNTRNCTLEALAEDIHNERRYRLIFELTTPGQYTLAITHLMMGTL